MAAAVPIAIRSAFVLGSTSEVAQAICRELAERGGQRIHPVARNGHAKQQLASDLQQRFEAAVSTETTDLLADATREPARRAEVGDFDLYLITAGSLGDARQARSDATEALRITAANYAGLLPWLTAIATPERIARQGRLRVFSSVAADRGRPSNDHYGAHYGAASPPISCRGSTHPKCSARSGDCYLLPRRWTHSDWIGEEGGPLSRRHQRGIEVFHSCGSGRYGWSAGRHGHWG